MGRLLAQLVKNSGDISSRCRTPPARLTFHVPAAMYDCTAVRVPGSRSGRPRMWAAASGALAGDDWASWAAGPLATPRMLATMELANPHHVMTCWAWSHRVPTGQPDTLGALNGCWPK